MLTSIKEYALLISKESDNYKLSMKQLRIMAVERILEGFRDLEEAKEWIELFFDREFYTPEGYPYDSKLLDSAIRFAEVHNKIKPGDR